MFGFDISSSIGRKDATFKCSCICSKLTSFLNITGVENQLPNSGMEEVDNVNAGLIDAKLSKIKKKTKKEKVVAQETRGAKKMKVKQNVNKEWKETNNNSLDAKQKKRSVQTSGEWQVSVCENATLDNAALEKKTQNRRDSKKLLRNVETKKGQFKGTKKVFTPKNKPIRNGPYYQPRRHSFPGSQQRMPRNFQGASPNFKQPRRPSFPPMPPQNYQRPIRRPRFFPQNHQPFFNPQNFPPMMPLPNPNFPMMNFRAMSMSPFQQMAPLPFGPVGRRSPFRWAVQGNFGQKASPRFQQNFRRNSTRSPRFQNKKKVDNSQAVVEDAPKEEKSAVVGDAVNLNGENEN